MSDPQAPAYQVSMTHARWLIVALSVLCLGWAEPSDDRAEPDIDYRRLASLSLEELMTLQVTSVAGVEQDWFRTPAAMYVITGEDVRRTGHLSIPEALRLAPGVHVGQINSNVWSVSTRGFGGRFANKQLVLIDGRTVYDPLFAGVLWNGLDVLMEDLDRIEVIRGPGATLWGANAVNGVINVTTRSAKDTQGLYLSGGTGTHEHAFGMARYGFQLDDDSWMRIWGKWFDRDNFDDPSGQSTHDEWDMARGGLRYDRDVDEDTVLTLQSEVYHSDRIGEQTSTPIPAFPPGTEAITAQDGRASGGHVLFRLMKETVEHEGWSIQGYYDRTVRAGVKGFLVERDTFDLDVRHFFDLGERHEVIWGLGYRHSRDTTRAGDVISFDPADRSLDTFSAFVQDTVTLVEDRLFFMAGSKFEHNDFTGFEFQPSARIWWTPSERQMFWGAVSRPVRVPSRIEEDLVLITAFVGPMGGPFFPLTFAGVDDVESEELMAYELGHRIKLTDSVTIDTALFYNDYRKLFALPTTGFGTFANGEDAHTYGVETAATWRVADNWRIDASYSFLEVEIGSQAVGNVERGHPHHMAQVRSRLDITRDLEFNAALYYVDHIRAHNADGYLRLDLGVTWHVTDQLEVAIWGQNLLEPSHREFNDGVFLARPSEVPRAVYIQATARF
jgi:iron complex outermembrane recepter protein